ncbi:hypothetical protein JRQ81_019536 [Phrynocephalus forsythii]|uniref:Ras-related protein Rab-30 n=1 Tax=Phrynocephalus forsythii TaxID=171643 RepID=A0A9Q0XPJ9_9SAUR|nr:hypothetical protein JRQ81_019536 [Phrynocephalus forsythii]
MSMEDYDFLFKIVLIGNAGVGKTCLVRRFTQGLFPPGQGATIGVDFMIKTVEINGEKVKGCMVKVNLEGSRVATECGDSQAQRRDSSNRECKNKNKSKNFTIVMPVKEYRLEVNGFCGNKIDLADKREVSQQRAEEFSEAQDMYYLETSAKESDNVEKLFLDLACRLIGEARRNTLVNNVESPSPGEGKSISYLTCCNFN